MSLRSIFIFNILLLLSSCSSDKNQNNGPIVLGDSSTIVTEEDPKYLSDYVDDIQLRTIPKDTIVQEAEQEIKATEENKLEEAKQTEQTEPIAQGKGLTVPFKEITVFIPEIETKSYRKQNPKQANGATYQWLDGRISGNQLQVSGATITKVSQRYLTRVVAKTELGTLALDALNSLTDWEPLKGNGKTYTITGLENPRAKNVTPSQIRLAVSRAAKNKRMSRQNIQKWERAVRNARSLNQKPFQIIVRSVMWKIEGKDDNGKNFQKQVRIDIHS